MVLRWTAAGVLEAERHFRRITGYGAMPKLVAALRSEHIASGKGDPRIDKAEDAA
jgi:putative transposase